MFALNALRAAPNSGKAALFSALEGVPCETPDLCALKTLCTSGYRTHLQALSDITRAKTLLAAPTPAAEASSLLDNAQASLDHAAPKLAQCTDAQGAAERKYRP